jgi:hypothetical protein
VNHTKITRVLSEAMQTLWPYRGISDNMLLLVTDAATYMSKAAVGLSMCYPKLTHVIVRSLRFAQGL